MPSNANSVRRGIKHGIFLAAFSWKQILNKNSDIDILLFLAHLLFILCTIPLSVIHLPFFSDCYIYYLFCLTICHHLPTLITVVCMVISLICSSAYLFIRWDTWFYLRACLCLFGWAYSNSGDILVGTMPYCSILPVPFLSLCTVAWATPLRCPTTTFPSVVLPAPDPCPPLRFAFSWF